MKVNNRLIRSATYEGCCDRNGVPTQKYVAMYRNLARGGCGTIITGFCYITQQGRAVQPLQAGIDRDENIAAFTPVADAVHEYGSRIIMQLAHCGKQTMSDATGLRVVGATAGAVDYFRERPEVLSEAAIRTIATQFIDAAERAQKAGFDGVQLHAAHGYLLHEFLLPSIRKRNDRYGSDPSTGISLQLLEEIVDGIRQRCSDRFVVLIKISGAVDTVPFSSERFINLITQLNKQKFDGIEISYGTMENALNIFRGASIPLEAILDHDIRYRQTNKLLRAAWKYLIAPFLALKIKRFTPMYNFHYAKLAKQHSNIPIITVGGFRSGGDIQQALASNETDFVAMCRPFIAEPDFADKIASSPTCRSLCCNCNRCAVTTGSEQSTVCRRPGTVNKGGE
jgi:2,4-dienoyl-CoA reductase-like NADH-dependent reductase (Old Yellow Enzyme family)